MEMSSQNAGLSVNFQSSGLNINFPTSGGLDSFIYVGSLIHSISLEKLELINDGIIVISNGKIVFIQNHSNNLSEIQKKYNVPYSNVYKIEKNQFLIPGFIDTHIHGCQYPNIGLGYEKQLMGWLETYTFPLEKKFSETSFAEKVYSAVVKKTLANGTTTACYFATIHEDSTSIFANIIKNFGQRALVGKVNMNQNIILDYGETYEESVKSTRKFIADVLALNSPLVKPIITPRFAVSCDMKLMKTLAQIAEEFDLSIQTHLAENKDEVKLVREEFPELKNYVDVYNTAGLVTNKTIFAHGIYLSSDELDVIKKKGATIAHCASSNNLLLSGLCPVRRYLQAGIKMSLGTDVSGGDSSSMLECIRDSLAVSIHAQFNNLGPQLTLNELFYLATLGGAEALNLQNVTGNFMPGKDFDAILVDLNTLDLLEDYNLDQLFQKFIHLGDDRLMKKVFVAGKIVKQL